MTEEEKYSMVCEAIKAWKSGELCAFSAFIAIAGFVDPPEITGEDLEWAREEIRKIGT